MILFDFNKIKGLPYEERHKNVLYKTGDFKIRVVDLLENGSMPECWIFRSKLTPPKRFEKRKLEFSTRKIIENLKI